jgi:tetratricopeptide (TPR) repeat protein
LTRVLVVYLGASYAVLEITDIFIDQIGLPDWVFPGVIVLLLMGLPIVVATALVQSRTRAGSAEAGAQLETLAASVGPEGESATVAAEHVAAKHWLTWRKAIVGFVAAFAVWGLVVAVFMTMRAFGIGPVGSLVAAGVIEERERIILADFENNTNDPLLGQAATEAFRIDFSQSSIVTVVEPTSLGQALQRMQRDPDQPLDEALAREVAIREGIKAVVEGEITPVGTSYQLSAQLVSAQDGQTLVAHRETARDSTQIIGAIDRLSKKLRERMGESLTTIRANEPLDQVTTPSLEALREYSQAVRLAEEGEHERAIPLLESAVQHDTAFAMAWRKLGITFGNLGRDRARQVEALTQAFNHRERLTDRERFMTEGSYYNGVTRDSDRAAAAYQALLDLYPNDTWAMNNLALIYFEDRDYRRSNLLFNRAIEVDSTSSLHYTNGIQTEVAIGDFNAAEEKYRRISEMYPDHPTSLTDGAALASAQFDYDLAEERLREASKRTDVNRLAQLALAFSQAQLAEIRGKLGEAEQILEQGALAFEQAGDLGNYYQVMIRIAFYDLMLRGQPDRGVQRVEEVLSRHPLEELDSLDRPYGLLAVFYVFAGRIEESREMLASAQAIDAQQAYGENPETQFAAALLATHEGLGEEAIRQVRLADVGSCSMCALPVLGQIYDAAGQTDSVVTVYERYLETPWLYRLAATDWWALAGIYERLAGLYELREDTDRAVLYYSKFVELWEDADAELQPRVEAARRSIERLTAEPAASQ